MQRYTPQLIQMPKSKKGAIQAFNVLRQGAVSFGLAVLFGASIALALSKVATQGGLTGASLEVVNNGTAGLSTLFSFSGTHMTILAIVVLILMVSLIKFTSQKE